MKKISIYLRYKMDISNIILSFSTEESSAFKSYLRAKNKRLDSKNIELYTLLRKETPITTIDTILYGKPNRNAYHALSKRLQDSLIDFIATRSFETETSEDMQVYKWILASRILYEQSQHKPAKKLLSKAIKKAQQLDLYTALVEIYHTQLQYSNLHPETPLQELTEAAQENMRRFIQQERLNMAYAHIKSKLSFDEQLLKTGIQTMIEETLATFDIEVDRHFTFKSLYQLLEIINRAAHLDHNFAGALPFITKTYTLVKAKNTIATKHRFYHIQILYVMANAHFRVRDFSKAQEYLVQMSEEMAAEKEKFKARFSQNYLLIHSFVLNYIGKGPQAILEIEQHINTHKKTVTDPDVILALIVFITQQEDYKKALTTVNTLRHTNTWYEERMGIDWLIKKELLTLIIYKELEYIDLVHATLRRFRRKYAGIIKTEPKLEAFIKIFTQIFNNPGVVDEDRFRESVKKLFSSSEKQEDILMLSFFAWIKSKLDKKPLYETTLTLL